MKQAKANNANTIKSAKTKNANTEHDKHTIATQKTI